MIINTDSSSRYQRCLRASLRFMFLSPLVWLVLVGSATQGWAQAESGKENRRVAKTLSQSGYRSLSEAQTAFSEEDFSRATELLNQVIEGRRYSDYDKAKAYQLRAFIHINHDHHEEAIADNRAALDLQVLDQSSELESLYGLANLYAYTEDYVNSIHFLERWFAMVAEPDAQALFTAAQVYALAEQTGRALEYAQRGMSMHRQDPAGEPRESWYRLLLNLYLREKSYPEASQLLEAMITHWPAKAEYYSQLSALYRELERDLDALLVAAIAHHNQLLHAGPEVERLLQLYRYHAYPFKGASLFDAHLKTAAPSSEEKWKLLGDAYAQARERDEAKAAYLEAAALADDGSVWLLLCQNAYRDNLWDEAIQYCDRALTAGGLDKEAGNAWQMLGMSRYHSGEMESATAAFRRCAEWQAVKQTCDQWLTHLEIQLKVEDQGTAAGTLKTKGQEGADSENVE